MNEAANLTVGAECDHANTHRERPCAPLADYVRLVFLCVGVD